MFCLFHTPKVQDAAVIVDGAADDAHPVDKVKQLQAILSIEVQGRWVEVGAGVGGSVVQHALQCDQIHIDDHVPLEALSALAPPGPGAGVPSRPGKADH